MMHRYLYSAIVSLILLSLSAHAQSVPELVTDRPDFTESPVVVPQGAVQLEFGATQEWDGDIESRTLPELLVRWAPLSWLELRLMVPDYITQAGASGFGDAGIGLKFGFGKILGWDAGAIAGVSLPTGEDGFSSESVDPEVLLTIGRDFGESWSFGLQGSGDDRCGR